MGSYPLELSLSLKPSFVPKTITNLLKDLTHIHNLSEKLSVLNDYLQKHREELTRVEAFKCELPHSILLLLESIEILEEEIEKVKKAKELESRRPLMKFLRVKRRTTNKGEQRNLLENSREGKAPAAISSNSDHLWIPNHDPDTTREYGSGLSLAPPMTKISRTENGRGGLNLRANDQMLNYWPKPLLEPIWKNNRRSWTPELHARFMKALNLLGGPEVATPKQIREQMRVAGLTNDQVKSHLQKYRLHDRILQSQDDTSTS